MGEEKKEECVSSCILSREDELNNVGSEQGKAG